MTPRVSIVIPSLDASRCANLNRLKAALAAQSFTRHEVIIIPGISPHGRAINMGVRRAVGDIIVIFDDDSSLSDPKLIEKLVQVLDSDVTLGMVGASIQAPPDANLFQRLAAREFPRFNVPVVDQVIDSDLVCHGCVAIPRALFEEVGMENEELVRGLDPDLRRRIRAKGRRIVLAPQCLVYHPLPPDLRSFARIFMRNGAGSAHTQFRHPEFAIDTEEQLVASNTARRRSLPYRLARFPLRIAWALLTVRPLRAIGYGFYAVGYLNAVRGLRTSTTAS